MIPRDKSKVIQLRVSEEFRKSIEHYADNSHETISDYIRKAVEMRMNLPTAISNDRKPSGKVLDTKEIKYISDGEKQESKIDKVLSQPPKFSKMVQYLGKEAKK